MIVIEDLSRRHWPMVQSIYRQGIETGHATFAPAPPESWTEWSRGKIKSCRLVAREDERVVGWAALTPASNRCVYRGVAEVSIYVASAMQGKGVGRSLLRALIERSEEEGIWTLQAGIFPENTASIRLHERMGFRRVGVREKVGYMSYGPMQGTWRDVVLLERRSKKTGIA